MGYFVQRRAFLILGLVTLAMFFVMKILNQANQTEAALALSAPLRALIIPMYIVWLPFNILQVAIAGATPTGMPAALAWMIWIVSLVAGLAPYALADHLLHRWRRPRTPADPGA
jgi:hypothetical protein